MSDENHAHTQVDQSQSLSRTPPGYKIKSVMIEPSDEIHWETNQCDQTTKWKPLYYMTN